MYLWPMVVVLVLVGWGQEALAQTLDNEFKTWRVFVLVRDRQKTCYITSSPVEQDGTTKRRSTPYAVVTHRDKNLAEMSLSAGYPYKDKSTVEITVDTQPKHAFFTSAKTPQIAWARDAAADKKIIEDMLKGARMTVAGQGQGKTSSTDTYDLQGFPQAYKRMQDLCKEDKPKDTRGKATKSTDAKKTDATSKAVQGKNEKSNTETARDSKPQKSQAQFSKPREGKPGDRKPQDGKARAQ